MDRDMLMTFRNALNKRLNEILPNIRHRLSGMLDSPGGYQEPMDEVDVTARRYQEEINMEIHRHTEELIQEIQEALRRIKKGSFGICQECGMDIEIQRLKVQPMAMLCLRCKRGLEAVQRRKVA